MRIVARTTGELKPRVILCARSLGRTCSAGPRAERFPPLRFWALAKGVSRKIPRSIGSRPCCWSDRQEVQVLRGEFR